MYGNTAASENTIVILSKFEVVLLSELDEKTAVLPCVRATETGLLEGAGGRLFIMVSGLLTVVGAAVFANFL